MMTVTLTCPECGSGIHVYPKVEPTLAECDVCQHQVPLHFNPEHEQAILKDCPCCERKDFYKQKDFNRKLGVTLFVIAAILSIFTYGLSFIVLYLFDLLLFRKLSMIAVCYKCQSIFRNISNINELRPYDHEMNDRIVYSDHDFKGLSIENH